MRHLPLLLIAATAMVGCNRDRTPKPAPGNPPVTTPSPAQADALRSATIQGKVLDRQDAPPYSYLKLQAGKDEVWVGVPLTDTKPGTEVKVVNAIRMEQFESKMLKRVFPTVFLGTLESQAPSAMDAAHGKTAAQAPPAEPQGGISPTAEAMLQAMTKAGPHDTPPPKGTPAPVIAKVENVAKAPGAEGRTVAEIHAQKTALKEKTVVVRGKVVKFNAQIMGKNWIHLQDGSGDPKAGSHDLTATSADAAKVGDVITVRGILRLKKDFGAGYVYDLIVEDAKISH